MKSSKYFSSLSGKHLANSNKKKFMPFITTKMFVLILITDIQEFYELTLLDESKTVQQKTAETLLIASKWEQENSIKLTDVSTTESVCVIEKSKTSMKNGC